MAIHSSILAWRIPWTEKPGGIQYMRSQRVGYDWVTNTLETNLRQDGQMATWAWICWSYFQENNAACPTNLIEMWQRRGGDRSETMDIIIFWKMHRCYASLRTFGEFFKTSHHAIWLGWYHCSAQLLLVKNSTMTLDLLL